MSGEVVSFRLEVFGEYLFHEPVFERVEGDNRASSSWREESDRIPEGGFYGTEFVVDGDADSLEAPEDRFRVVAGRFDQFREFFGRLDRFRFAFPDDRFCDESGFRFFSVGPEHVYELTFACMVHEVVCGLPVALAIESHVELAGKPEGESSVRIVEVRGGDSEIIADSRDGVNTDFGKFCFDIAEVGVEEMEGDSMVSRKLPDIFFDMLFGAFEIVVIEIEPDKDVSLMKFLDDSHSMTSEPEGAVDHDIPLSRAQIEAVYVLVVEHRNMSKTFFVQNVKK